ncbi:MAG: hypothetical protein ABI216_17805 [Devosia sp.]
MVFASESGSMPNRFDKFVHDENLKDFGRQIEIETDPTRLALLKTLLREEQGASSGRRAEEALLTSRGR